MSFLGKRLALARTTGVFARYSLAVAAVAVSTMFLILGDPILDDRMSLAIYLFAVIVVAWFAGAGPALLTLISSVPVAAWLFLPPRNTFEIDGMPSYLAVGFYLLQGLAIVVFGLSLRNLRNRAAQAKVQYDTRFEQVAIERQRLHRDLQQLTEELREVDKQREDFLSLLADELRGPLLPIVSATSFLNIAATASEMESAMEVVKRETVQLGRLIEELLSVFRDGQRSISLHRQRLDLVQPVCDAAESVRSLVAQTGRQLSVSLSKEPLWVDADAPQIERVIYNLLVNAIRSTPAGGHLWLTAREDGDHAMISVRDTGQGLDPDGLARVFEPFGQFSSPLGREGGLFRIGLIAVRQVVESHGGAVEAHSDGRGLGTQFIVRLPRLKVEALEAAAHSRTPA